jgi:hypothetical protein
VLHARPSHTVWLDESVQIVSILVMQFSPASWRFIFLGLNIFISLFSESPNGCFPHSCCGSNKQVLFSFNKRERDSYYWDFMIEVCGIRVTGYIITAIKMKW